MHSRLLTGLLPLRRAEPMDEADEKVRLQKIIERIGVRSEIREALTVELLLWKHDEDLM